MKRIATIFGLGLVGLMIIIYFDNRQVISQATHRAADAAVDWLIVVLWTALIVGVVAVFGLLYLAYLRGPHNERNRMRDGSHELQRHRIRRAWWDVFGWFTGVTVIIDPNLMESAVAYIGNDGYIEGPAIREPVRIEVQRTRHIGAMYPGDGVLGTSRAPVMQPKPASMKSIAAAPVKPSTSALPALPGSSERVTPVTMYGAGDLQARNTPTEIVIGQSPEDGSLAKWYVTEQPHIRLHGETRNGKTALAMYIALAALVQGWRVVVLDRRRYKDWGALRGHAELCDATQPADFAAYLSHVAEEYQRRDALLSAHGASDLAMLPANLRPVRTMVVVEEFGVQLINARAENAHGAVLDALRPIAQEAGACGVHLLMVDQLPVDWDRAVKANVGAVVTFRQPDQGAGQAAGYHGAHRLQPYHFAMAGAEYKAPYIAAEKMAEGLRRMGIAPQPVLMDGVAVRPSAAPDTDTRRRGGGQPDTPADTDTDTATDAQQRIIDYYVTNPDAGVREAARVLGLSKSYVSDVRRAMVDAEPSTPPQADIAGRPQTVIDVSDPANAAALAEIRQAIEAGQANVKPRR